MSESAEYIMGLQRHWAEIRSADTRLDDYVKAVRDNLFQPLHPRTKAEFQNGDGAELKDSRTRPAKMRALISSSALAVNFFDTWRDLDKTQLAEALGLAAPISDLRFEFKTRHYPVGPRSPNLDLLFTLEDGQRIGVESKFSEPYRSDEGHGALSARYFPGSKTLWADAHLAGAQSLALHLRPEWIRLDAPQLLKHMLGLAHDSDKPATLLYLWFDTGKPDAADHLRELNLFAAAVAGDCVAFRAQTYQSAFDKIGVNTSPIADWHAYMKSRYFAPPLAS